MTDGANPEVLLFASTAQAFLEREASLTRLRELHAAGVSFEVYRYPGVGHLWTDSGLAEFDGPANDLVWDRCAEFLRRLSGTGPAPAD